MTEESYNEQTVNFYGFRDLDSEWIWLDTQPTRNMFRYNVNDLLILYNPPPNHFPQLWKFPPENRRKWKRDLEDEVVTRTVI